MDDLETLKDENKKLSKIIEAKSDLISITAHQLRTSLSALKWIFNMFIKKDFGPLTEEQEDYLDKAIISNERMLRLVTTLLSLNHAEDPTMIPSMQDVDVEKLINEAIVEFYGETHNKNIAFELSKQPSHVPHVIGDPTMIRVVLEGVVENAIKYSDQDGTVKLSLAVENADTLLFSIHNNGISIPEAEQPHIFNKFFRAPNAKSTVISGSGLGLFIAKNIITQHHGSISFESTKDAGTTFFVRLPLLQRA